METVDTSTKVVNYKCPNCGGPLVMNIENQKWECNFCLSSFDSSQIHLFEQLEDSQEVKEFISAIEPELFSTDEVIGFSCPNCGGEIITEPNTLASFCPYCHNPSVIAAKLKGIHKPALILPFEIPRAQVEKQLKKMIKGKILLPRPFREAVDKGEITGLYVPFWLFSGTISARMLANAYRYTTWRVGDYDYHKTDTYQAQREGDFPFKLIPVDASQRLDNDLMDSIEPYQYDKLSKFDMAYLSGFFAEGFDVDAEESSSRFYNRGKDTAYEMLKGTITGYNQVSTTHFDTFVKNLENTYVLLPVWTVSVEYKNKIYSLAVNGQTGKSAGKLPISKGRVAGLFFGIFAIVMLLFFAKYFISFLLG